MIILATDSNDKGKQLEALTKQLLLHRGYVNCTTNVMANGAEIDVRGEFPLPGLGSVRNHKLLCECKAQKSTVDMTQWCKFLGKIYHQEVCSQTEVSGCFISLSGVNGHVQGSFDELAKHKQGITLLHGDALLAQVAEIIPVLTLQQVSQLARSKSKRTVSRFESAYRDGSMYWIVVFSEGEYTILDATGKSLGKVLEDTLSPMVEFELDVSKYINLESERQAQLRNLAARNAIVHQLFLSEKHAFQIAGISAIENLTAEELRAAALDLIGEGLLKSSDGGIVEIPINETESGPLINPQLFKQLFSPALTDTKILECKFYSQHINRALLDEVSRIQGNLPLKEADLQKILYIFRISPSALLNALTPMEMIVTGREQAETPDKRLDEFHWKYFKQAAIDGFSFDFRTQPLSAFYHEYVGLREVETAISIKLKGNDGLLLCEDMLVRRAVAPVDETLGGGYVLVNLFDDCVEPWEEKPDQDAKKPEQPSTPEVPPPE